MRGWVTVVVVGGAAEDDVGAVAQVQCCNVGVGSEGVNTSICGGGGQVLQWACGDSLSSWV